MSRARAVYICGGDDRPGPRGTDCPDPLHDHPLPRGYVDASGGGRAPALQAVAQRAVQAVRPVRLGAADGGRVMADHRFCVETVEWWQAEVERVERQNDLLWLVLCVGLPVAIVVGTVLGALTWGSQ